MQTHYEIFTEPHMNLANMSERLGEIIRGERSAVETYAQVTKMLSGDDRFDVLMHYSANHLRAVQHFVDLARGLNMLVPKESGFWGFFAKMSTGAAKAIGPKAALTVLKQGEEHGLKLYVSLVEDEVLDSNLTSQLKTYFIPQQKRHIEGLEKLISRI